MFDWLFKRNKRKPAPQSNIYKPTISRSNRSSSSDNDLLMTNVALSSVSYDSDDCSKQHHSHSSDSDSSYDSGSSYSDSGSSSSCD